MAVNPVKEDLHRLVEALPDEEAPAARRFLQWLLSEGNGDEELTPKEMAEAEAGWREYQEGIVRPWSEVRKELAHE